MIKQELMERAKSKGICKEGYSNLRCMDRDTLIGYYIENPDWCMERDFPDLATLKESFADCEEKGIYINKIFHGETLNDLQTYIFHNCKGTINVNLNIEKSIIPMLYLGNGCRLRIVGTGDIIPQSPSKVSIYTFGKNDLSARDNKYVEFNIYKNDII